jgi:hypothetical protein
MNSVPAGWAGKTAEPAGYIVFCIARYRTRFAVSAVCVFFFYYAMFG